MDGFSKEETPPTATEFVQRFRHFVAATPECDDAFKGVDDPSLLKLALRFVRRLESFRSSSKPINIQIGFHYTKDTNLESILETGLSADAQRAHGRVFGDGIYLGLNPHAFLAYGNTGIVLLFVKGVTKQLARDEIASANSHYESADTLIGNKRMESVGPRSTDFPTTPYFDEVVLRRSDQILPIMTYSHTLVNNAEQFLQLQKKLQAWVDNLWNQTPTRVERVLPSLADIEFEANLRRNKFAVWNIRKDNRALDVVHCAGPDIRFDAPPYVLDDSEMPQECPICLDQVFLVAKLCGCKHSFHEECIKTWLAQSSNTCPVCEERVGKPWGKCPPGYMTVWWDTTLSCHGVFGVHVIQYTVPSGIQSDCHENPGQPFRGDTRWAYVPDAPGNGADLIKRLKFAFRHGLTFTIGTSRTTGRSNVLTWSSIPHKSSLKQGLFGFPDHGYHIACNDELDVLGVPKSTDL